MLSETERKSLEQEFLKSWDIAEWVYHDLLVIRPTKPLEAFYQLIQELRNHGYDEWFDCNCEASALRLIRGKSWLDMAHNSNGALELRAEIAGKQFRSHSRRIHFTNELKILLDFLMLQDLE